MFEISKEVECVFNPFELNCKDKRILTKVYQELGEYSKEQLFQVQTDLNRAILYYLDELIRSVPYHLEYSVNMDIVSILKAFDVRIDSESSSLADRIIDYIRLTNKVLRKRIFVFVNLKQYLSELDLHALYEFVFYEKVYLIIVEGCASTVFSEEQHQVLDRSLCLIEY